MTARDGDYAPATRRLRWPLRGMLVAVFILVVGPPVGALLMSVPLYFWAGQPSVSNFSGGAWRGELQAYFSTIYVMVLFSHFVGGIQALLSALWLGLRTFWRGTFGYGEAVLVALIVSLIWALRYGDIRAVWSWFDRTDDGVAGGFQLTLIALSVASALICRWLLRIVRILPP